MTAWIPFLSLGAVVAWALPRLGLSSGPAGRLGLGMLLGLGSATTLLTLAALAGMPLRPIPGGALLATAVLGFVLVASKRKPLEPPSGVAHRDTPWTPAEGLLLLAIGLLVLIAAWRGAFYPVSAMDAHSYDGRARWTLAEGRLDLSVYRSLGVTGASNLTYPPLYPLGLVMPYWLGAAQGKAADAGYLLATLLILVEFLGRHLPRLGGLAGAALLALAPELWLHLSLGLTNLPAMAYFAAGLIVTATALFDGSPAGPRTSLVPWILAGLCFLFAAGVRSDALVLAAPVTLAAAVTLRSRRLSWPHVLVRASCLLLPAILFTLAWQVFLKSAIGVSNAAPFRSSLLPDPGLLGSVIASFGRLVIEPGLYGWAFYLAVPAFLLSLFSGQRHDAAAGASRWLFLVSLLLATTLIALFQQIDPSFGGGGGSYLRNSLKRALFYLLPGVLAGSLLAPPVRSALVGFDRWQRS